MPFRCEKLPEDNQQDFYEYYAIDIGNSQPVIQLINAVRALIEEYGIYSIRACDFLNTSIFLLEYPPCDPVTLKLRPMCVTQCPEFSTVIASCFGVQTGVALVDFVSIYDSYNCSNPTTYLPGASGGLFDSQEQCYYVTDYTLGKCVYNFLVFVVNLSSMKLSSLNFLNKNSVARGQDTHELLLVKCNFIDSELLVKCKLSCHLDSLIS